MELLCVDNRGWRRVNHREALALIYTYEVPVGKALIDRIRIEYVPDLGDKRGRVGFNEKRKIRMRSDYNPENLKWLGVFIHESVHIWQANTWHNFGVGLNWAWPVWKQSYDYNEEQLTSLDLGLEQLAEAVEDWFLLNYGLESCLIGETNQIKVDKVWEKFTDVFDGEEYQQGAGRDLKYLQGEVNSKYDALLEKIQAPDPPRGKPLFGPDANFSLSPAYTTGFRRVNQREAMALAYTFGQRMGNAFIDGIEIGEGHRDSVSRTQMLLPPTHDPENLDLLGKFVRKAARIWQIWTGHYTQDGGSEDYTPMQVHRLNLTGPQHAKAVEDWFKVNYFFDYCDNRRTDVIWDDAVQPIVDVMGVNIRTAIKNDVLRFVKRYYANLMEELRDP